MANLDVSDILLDPDFMDVGLVCRRGIQAVGNSGRSVLSIVETPFAGVVTADKGDFLERLAGAERKNGSITIHTLFRLTSGVGDVTADTVSWRGKQYTVTNVSNYGHFGRGFISASCDLLPLAG